MPRIESVQNPEVKFLVSLQRTRERIQAGLFLVEGPHLVREALAAEKDGAGAEVTAVYHTAEFAGTGEGAQLLGEASRKGITITELSAPAFSKAAETETPQGVMAVARLPRPSLDDMRQGVSAVFLDRVQDPGNMGTIIRTAAAAGIDAVLVSRQSADPYSGKAVRASQGGIFAVPVVTGISGEAMIAWCRRTHTPLACTSPHEGRYYFDLDLASPGVIVLGHETTGVTDEMFQNADVLVRIPIIGHAESLNVASAAAVLIYEVCRQKLCRPRP